MSKSVKAAIFVSILLNVLILVGFFSKRLPLMQGYEERQRSQITLDEGVVLHFDTPALSRLERVEGISFWEFGLELPKIAPGEALILTLALRDGEKKNELARWMYVSNSFANQRFTLAVKTFYRPGIGNYASLGTSGGEMLAFRFFEKDDLGRTSSGAPETANIFRGEDLRNMFSPDKATLLEGKQVCDLITGAPRYTDKEIIGSQKRLYLVVTKGKAFSK